MKLSHPDETPAIPLLSPVESATVGYKDGLHAKLLKIYEWAESIGLLSPLLLLIDASRTAQRDQYLGTVIHYLAQPIPRALLKDWAAERDYLNEIGALADAFAITPEIHLSYHALPDKSRLKKRLQDGDLTKLFIVALTARPISNNITDNHRWIETVRTWCVVEVIEHVRNNAPISGNLIEVIRKLRQGIDTSSATQEWLLLFCRLKAQVAGLYGLRRHLISESARLRETVLHEGGKAAHAILLRHMSQLDTIDSSKSDQAAARPYSNYYLRHLCQHVATAVLPQGEDWTDWEDANAPEAGTGEPQVQVILPSAPGELTALKIDPSLTPAEQHRTCKGIHLLTVEEQQRLPLSWDKPSPAERARLLEWIHSTAQDSELTHAALGALVYVAAQTAHSLRRALEIEISAESADDWRLDPRDLTLHRRPPRRRAGAKPTARALQQVRPAAKRLIVRLPEPVEKCLAKLRAAHPSARKLIDWYGDPTVLRQEVRAALESAGLERISLAMTGGWLAQEIFERSLDPVLTQLLTSNSRSGLSGACAYASYGDEIRKSMILKGEDDALTILPQGGGQALNCAGSQLDAQDAWLRQCFSQAHARVEQLAQLPEQWHEHHNALVVYILGALFAGTGARPVTSPFEAPTDFDLQAGTVYVEDKVSSNLHRGRLLPLPDLVKRLVSDLYLSHLKSLAQIVRIVDEALSAEIDCLQTLQNSKRLPFFFFLTASGHTLGHLEVSEATLNATGILQLELPWNVFRHRQSTYLKRNGVDHEVINGLLGHTDNGTSTWGPYSSRTWQDDTDAVRPHLDQTIAALGIEAPSLAQCTPSVEHLASLHPPAHRTDRDLHGREAREKAKQTAHDSARQQARFEIERFVLDRSGGKTSVKPPPALTPDDLDRLARQMLYRADNLPHPRAALRYEEFTQWVANTWATNGPRLKKRYLPRLEEASPFSSHAPKAPEVYREATEWFHGASLKQPRHQIQVRSALAAATCGLILESRVVNRNVIASLMKNKDYRLVRMGGRYFLEHAQHLDKFPDAPASRYAISHRTALRFSTARASTYAVDLTVAAVDEAYAPLQRLCGLESDAATYTNLFGRLAHFTGQLNWQRLPGLVAGYLEGSVVSVGFEHSDWLRLHTGSAHEIAALMPRKTAAKEKEAPEEAGDEWEVIGDEPNPANEPFLRGVENAAMAAQPHRSGAPFGRRTKSTKAPIKRKAVSVDRLQALGPDNRSPSEVAQDASQQMARSLMARVNSLLNKAGNSSPNVRRDLDAALRQTLHEYAGASTSCRIFADWVRSLLGQKTRSGRPLALRSVQRYFFSLSSCFEQVAYDHNLVLCDEEEVTKFYANLMDARKHLKTEPASVGMEPTPGAASLAASTLTTPQQGEEKTYKTWRLAFASLRRFHRFVSHCYDVEEPDWSEVGDDEATLSIAPRLLREKEYLHALEELAGDPLSLDMVRSTRCYLLILTQRFGLRGEEATGLAQGDWVEGPGAACMVLVRSNKFRRLKTTASRRQVPLLFHLTDLEQVIIRRHHELLIAASGADADRRNDALFPHLAGPENKAASKSERAAISAQLKRSTLNPRTSVHAARHSFANMVELMLLDINPQLLEHLFAEAPTAPWIEHVRRTTLGTHTRTRRTPWALARLMGHSHPRTALKSYVHLLPDLACSHLEWAPDAGVQDLREKRLEQVLDLDQAKTRSEYLLKSEIIEAALAPTVPTAQETLKALRLMQQGWSLTRIASACSLTSQQIDWLHQLITDIDAILQHYPKINPKKGGTSVLLSHISASRFDALIASAAHVSFENTEDLIALNAETLEPDRLIGRSKQIVLFDRSQFQFLADLLHRWGWPPETLSLISSRRIPADYLDWAQEAGFKVTPVENMVIAARTAKHPAAPQAARKRTKGKPPREKQYYQLDWVFTGPKRGRTHDRCVAMPAAPKNLPLTSRNELVTLVATHLFLLRCVLAKSQTQQVQHGSYLS